MRPEERTPKTGAGRAVVARVLARRRAAQLDADDQRARGLATVRAALDEARATRQERDCRGL